MVSSAEEDALPSERYDTPQLAAAIAQAQGGDPAALARAELMLSTAYVRYVGDLHQPSSGARTVFTDPAAAPPFKSAPRSLLESAAKARSLHDHLIAVRRMNPLYMELRNGLEAYRARWSKLPQVAIAPGPVLQLGSAGERIRKLRRRLGLWATGPDARRYDTPLADSVREFQAAHGLPATGIADKTTVATLNAGPAPYEQLIRANLDRLRVLPPDLGPRYILVDTAAAQLGLYEDGQLRDTMRVIVGKPEMQTPLMASAIRFVILNPYWNVPPDLVRDRVAPRVLHEGMAYFQQDRRMEALSDWSDTPRVLDPTTLDWNAVASGQRELRVRQLPGPGNMMGAIKFMMPNDLGIYLHDTPEKALFESPDRRLSSGCVRVEAAQRLSRWLFRGATIKPSTSGTEQRKNLPKPVPVYITYVTAAATPAGIEFRPDIYGRDPVVPGRSLGVKLASTTPSRN